MEHRPYRLSRGSGRSGAVRSGDSGGGGGPRGRSAKAQARLDDRFGDYLVATCNAVRRLGRTPAPDLEALGVKIALAVDERGWELTGGERFMQVLKADARRLCPRS